MDLLGTLADLPPTWIWGLVSRGIGLTYLISFASISAQVIPIAGARGITPIAGSLRAVRQHFSPWKRIAYFPTLLWFGSGDALLRALPWIGIALSCTVIAGGPHVPWTLAVLYLVYLSLDRAIVLVYPWDCLLFEAGFWGVFLPATAFLPDLRAVAAPLPAVVWVYRLLVFRVILGFGKHKFVGTTPDDIGFLKGFLVNQPLPALPGWLGQKLPMWCLRLGLVAMFVVEVLLPGVVFFPGKWSVIGALSIIGLMGGIELTGNFGYFNVITVVASLSWFDTRTALAFHPGQLFVAGGPVLVNALAVLHTALAFVSFPFNTFCAHTWPLWPLWERVSPRVFVFPVWLVRALHPLRWLHAYGVFPPHTPPSVKIVPVVEVSWDGSEWHALQHRYSPTVETSPPRFCAPHHERFDQAVVYEAIGLNEASIMRNIVGRWDPYGYGGVPGALAFVHRVLEGTVPGDAFYDRSLERQRGRPLVARVRTYMLEPTSLAERKREGRYWKRTLIGPHFPPMRLEDGYWSEPLPAPELWHPDDIVWLRRSRLGDAMKRAAKSDTAHDFVLLHGLGLGVADVERFWAEFMPWIAGLDRHDWNGIHGAVDVARTRFDRATLHRFERIAARYAVLLSARLSSLVPRLSLANAFGLRPDPDAKLSTEHHLRLFAYHVLGEGRSRYDAVFRDPSLAPKEVERMTMHSGNYVQAVFRYEAVLYQCQKLRLMAAFAEHEGRRMPAAKSEAQLRLEAAVRGIVGSLHVVDFLKNELRGREQSLDCEEAWPTFRMQPDGEVKPVKG